MSPFVHVAWPAAVTGIQYISSASGVDSVTMPTHQTDDVLVAFAFRDGSDTAPSLASGWTSVTSAHSSGSGPASARVGRMVATSSSMASGTWTNATSLVVVCYRGVDTTTPVGGYATRAGTTNGLQIEAVTMSVSDGTSWIVGVAGHVNPAISFDDTLTESTREMTPRVQSVQTGDVSAAWDTNEGVTSWTRLTHTLTGTAGYWRSFAVELLEAT